ncbi:MAG: hypothetical protein OXH77_11720 [Anaerolineaceae bacterium]|nr:hypothetical protein [Anaerolineaceae bacterium]MDE0610560.1 hypothetical protein [Anaerolineaceae bacterium]
MAQTQGDKSTANVPTFAEILEDDKQKNDQKTNEDNKDNDSGGCCGCLVLLVLLLGAILILDPGFFDRIRGISPQPARSVSPQAASRPTMDRFERARSNVTATARARRTAQVAVSPVAQTYFVISSRAFVNARSCPDISCGVLREPARGSKVAVLEEVEGEEVGGSSSWWRVVLPGESREAYIHGPLLGRYPPPALNATATPRPTQVPVQITTTQPSQQQRTAPSTRSLQSSASAYVNAIQSVFRTSSNLDVGVPVVSGSKSGGGFRQVTVGYWPWASNPTQAQIRQELLAIFRLIARAMINNNLTIDRITVTANYDLSATGGKAISSSSGNLLAWYRGQISDTVFLNRLS